MELERLKGILSKFKSARIGVVGDYCLDAYWMLDNDEKELSLETGKPTNAVISQRYSLGGAANVVANLAAMGVGTIKTFAVVGNDVFGREMINLLDQLNVDRSGIVIQESNWNTSVYAKPYLGNEEQERIDFGRFNIISPETEDLIISNIEKNIPAMDVLIINQQLPRGVHSEKVIKVLNQFAEKYKNCKFIADSRNKSESFYHMILKINAIEAARICGEKRDVNRAIPVDDLERYAKVIYEKSHKPVIMTRGDRGLVVYCGEQFVHIPGIQILKRTDPVGAGDTIAAALAASLSVGATFEEAGRIANFAATVTVQKLKQTGTASPDEILNVGIDTDYVYNPELADDIRKAHYLENTQIEIINPNLELGKIRFALFDHDGTVSTLRQGWESIMEPVMIKAILGDYYKKATEEEYYVVVERSRDYIDRSTGILTILQMEALVEMVKEFGYVPENQILDAKGYKKIYNDALMELINKRIERIKKGELDVNDYTMKGAVKFLEELYKRGIVLYLASGTDEEDVKNEAKVLGYAHLFKGGIFGAVGDVTKCSKKMVIENIIKAYNLSGSQLICFGDGPVELRETKKQGGITVGIASDEVRRYELNSYKRSRLVKAGADIIIPDFSQGSKLLNYLNVCN